MEPEQDARVQASKQESPSRTHFRLHLALYCHSVHRSDKNYPLPQSTVAGNPGSLFWIGVLPSVKLGCGSNNFRPNNNSFSLRLRPQSLQRRRDRHWQSLHFPRCLIDFRKRSIRGGSRGGGGGGAPGAGAPPLLLLHRFIFLLTNLLPLRCNSSSARKTVRCLKPNGLGTRPRSSIPLRVCTYYVRERNLSKEEAHGTCSAKREGATRAHPEK